MNIDFSRGTAMMKALADETRVRIIHILSCGELCACDILSYFDIAQPTLSHHLSILVDEGIVTVRREGKWSYYCLSIDEIVFFRSFFESITEPNDACACKKMKRKCNEQN